MKLGIYGGTFDPFHRGHLAVALAARDAHGLDRCILMPAGIPPHKRSRSLSSGDDRLCMARLATEDQPGLEVSDLELLREGPSFTVETLEHFHREEPEAELYFIVGADSVPEMPSWRSLPHILELARIVAVCRPGYEASFDPLAFWPIPESVLARCRSDRVEMPPSPISSTAIRERVRQGEPVDHWVGPAVARHIEARGLYRESDRSQNPG